MEIAPRSAHRRTAPRAAGVLMLAGAATLALASAVHFGASIPVGAAVIRDPFGGAAVPEAVLAVIVAAGACAVLARMPKAWAIGVATTAFAVLVVLFGLSITVRGGRTGDIAYHAALLLVLLATSVLLARSAAANR